MNYKLTEKAEEMKKKIANQEEFDTSPFGGGDGFWYDITNGYFKPEEVFEDKELVTQIKLAKELLEKVEEAYQEIVPEF